jgi:hypothetical protein
VTDGTSKEDAASTRVTPGSAEGMENHEEDPRGTDVAEGGYPEEQEPGADPGSGTRTREGDDSGTPDTSSSQDSGPGTATGNPGAAGA